MNIQDHVDGFRKIVDKYNLKDKAEEISSFLTSGKGVSPKEFCEKFGMTQEESHLFLSFIEKGIRFKEKHIDNK